MLRMYIQFLQNHCEVVYNGYMKIGIYNPYLDTMSGGEKYMLTAASYLSAKNDVTLFWDDPKILDKAQKKLNIDLKKVSVKPNIFYLKTSVLSKLLQTVNYDRLIILSDGSIPLTLAKKTFLHFQYPVEWVGLDLKTKLKLMKIDRIICNSFFTKKFIDKKFGLESIVLYPPCIRESEVDEILKSKIEKEKKNILLTVGRYAAANGSSIKKQEIMIKVFKQMVDKGLRNSEFIIATSFLQENERSIQEIEASVRKYPIKIVKNASYEELKKLYSDAKIYWHATGFGEDIEKYPERAEHFGITTVEAMAHKTVPIVYAAGGQAEIVDDGVNGFLWQTEEELAQKTKKLMLDEKLRIEIGNLGFKKAQLFTTEKFCEQLEEIIR